MPLFISRDRAILFLHVPKCGGTSIAEMFTSSGYFPQLLMRGLPPQDSLSTSPQHQTCGALRPLLNFGNLSDTFLITRNPYDRLRSEYNWSLRKTPLKDRVDFSEWVTDSLAKAGQDPLYSDSHFRPALDFLDIHVPAKIFRLEDGIELIAEYFLSESHEDKTQSTKHMNDSASRPESSRNLKFNSRALTAANRFYFYDFLAFGYPLSCSGGSLHSFTEHQIQIPQDKSLNAKAKIALTWRMRTLLDLQAKTFAKIRHEIGALEKRGRLSREINDYCNQRIEQILPW
jgi:hypothetical protein